MRYHINPKTGNPGLCKAEKAQCPFEQLGEAHYPTKEAAREGYELLMTSQISRGASLALRRTELHEEIIMKHHWGVPFAEISPLITIQQNIDNELATLPAEGPTTAFARPQGELKSFHSRKGKINVGVPNSIEDIFEKHPEALRALKEASHAWAKTLSTGEVGALYSYSHSHDSYKLLSEQNEKASLAQEAIARPMKFTKPITVFSGISQGFREQMIKSLEANDGETITISRAFSTSLNPGQANAFASMEEPYYVEVEASEGCPLYSISAHPHELEVILPPGDYELIETKTDVGYNYGTTEPIYSKKTYVLRQLPRSS